MQVKINLFVVFSKFNLENNGNNKYWNFNENVKVVKIF